MNRSISRRSFIKGTVGAALVVSPLAALPYRAEAGSSFEYYGDGSDMFAGTWMKKARGENGNPVFVPLPDRNSPAMVPNVVTIGGGKNKGTWDVTSPVDWKFLRDSRNYAERGTTPDLVYHLVNHQEREFVPVAPAKLAVIQDQPFDQALLDKIAATRTYSQKVLVNSDNIEVGLGDTLVVETPNEKVGFFFRDHFPLTAVRRGDGREADFDPRYYYRTYWAGLDKK